MFSYMPDGLTLLLLMSGAFAAGFTTGLAGFGTALIASGVWMHGLPPVLIPPLVTIAAVIAQLVTLATARPTFDWAVAKPFLLGGLIGIPFGVAALKVAHPETVTTAVGVFLLVFAASQLFKAKGSLIGNWGGRRADTAVGIGGGVLGGFAGLSGPLPIIWLQLRGGAAADQRAIFQPFNLIVLTVAGAGMALAGLIDGTVLVYAVIATPLTILGSWVGARVYLNVSEKVFRRVVLVLLMLSGFALVARGVF